MKVPVPLGSGTTAAAKSGLFRSVDRPGAVDWMPFWGP